MDIRSIEVGIRRGGLKHFRHDIGTMFGLNYKQSKEVARGDYSSVPAYKLEQMALHFESKR